MHFATGVILPKSITKKSGARRIRQKLDELLFCFSEDFELKPYITECDCIAESRYSFKKRNPRHGKVDPSCPDCQGSGKMITTENLFARFDWWEIGGQWDGVLAPQRRSASTLWQNCVEVRTLLDDHFFYSLVTPNKEWREESEFMKGKRTIEKATALWNDYQKKLLKKYKKNLVILVDCHC